MNPKIESLYSQIGQTALGLAEGLAGKLLVYAEVEEGVVSADIFYMNDGGDVRFRFAPRSMKELIYSFWELWKQEPGNQEWRAFSYLIEDGRFKIDMSYPDEINPDEDTSERRPVMVKKHFGDLRMDYSKPQ